MARSYYLRRSNDEWRVYADGEFLGAARHLEGAVHLIARREGCALPADQSAEVERLRAEVRELTQNACAAVDALAGRGEAQQAEPTPEERVVAAARKWRTEAYLAYAGWPAPYAQATRALAEAVDALPQYEEDE